MRCQCVHKILGSQKQSIDIYLTFRRSSMWNNNNIFFICQVLFFVKWQETRLLLRSHLVTAILCSVCIELICFWLLSLGFCRLSIKVTKNPIFDWQILVFCLIGFLSLPGHSHSLLRVHGLDLLMALDVDCYTTIIFSKSVKPCTIAKGQ